MEEKYREDLREIRQIMDRSSRFISLSGLSGIAVGVSALIGAFVAQWLIFSELGTINHDRLFLSKDQLITLITIAIGTILLAAGTGIYFTTRATLKTNNSLWDQSTKRMLVNLVIPLIAGGFLCLALLFQGFFALVAPLTLVFHGLALVNTSKYTLTELRSLGLLVVLLGIFGVIYVHLGLLLWALGFGLLHIIYGVYMQWKYQL